MRPLTQIDTKKTIAAFHTSDLHNNPQSLEKLIQLYFAHQGQTKYVAQHLGIRRNTLICVIKDKVIPYIAKIWIEQCQGDVAQLAKKLGYENNTKFQKTLRWHNRFDIYISAIDVDSENRVSIAKALYFLRDIPEPPQAEQFPLPSSPFVPLEQDLLYRLDPGADNPESISRKITKLKTLKFGTMMILGETGAGKGWLSRKIYEYLYPKKDRPYVHINCAHLISAAVELFGSVKGAFTDAVDKAGALEKVVNGGILFLDEIDALPMDVQMRLLLVLGEEGFFYRVGSTKAVYMQRFTLITATNQNLELMVENDRFRQDLLGRINQPCIRLKTWHQHPEGVKHLIIQELEDHIIENDFEEPYATQLQEEFQLSNSQMEILLHSQYTYNIRSVRKQITEFMSQFLLERSKLPIAPFVLH